MLIELLLLHMKPVVSTHSPTLPFTLLTSTFTPSTHNIGEEGKRDARKGSSFACRSYGQLSRISFFMALSNPKWGRKWYQILANSVSRGGLEVLGDPPGAKMAQDVSRVASSISRDLGSHLGAKMGKESTNMGQVGAKLAPRWINLGLRWPT